MMRASSLASGSQGNSYVVETEDGLILVDLGISFRDLVCRLSYLKASPLKLKALFITHEHLDHIRGVVQFLKHTSCPLYITKKTMERARLDEKKWSDRIHLIEREDVVEFGSTVVQALPKCHDAAEPLFFNLFHRGCQATVLTDTGVPDAAMAVSISRADLLFLESNHDVEMLKRGPYPEHLKKRILSPYGHLSNQQASSLVAMNASERLRWLFLSHISEHNNTPETALLTLETALSERTPLKELKRVLTTPQAPTPWAEVAPL